jgi:hypothetical protein
MALRRIFVVLAIGAILMGLASTTFVWAAPGQSPVRQTLPTKTPLVPPTKDKPTSVPTFVTPTPTRWTGTAMPVVTVLTPPLPQTLPASGAGSSALPLALVAAGALLVYIGLMARQRTLN